MKIANLRVRFNQRIDERSHMTSRYIIEYVSFVNCAEVRYDLMRVFIAVTSVMLIAIDFKWFALGLGVFD